MTAKDWFILGIRLIGLGILYFGIQEALAYVVRDMLFANVDPLYYPQQGTSWSRLLHGGANIGIALLALTKAKRFADWCYDKDRPMPDERELNQDAGESPEDAFDRRDAVAEPSDPVDKNYT